MNYRVIWLFDALDNLGRDAENALDSLGDDEEEKTQIGFSTKAIPMPPAKRKM